MGAGAIVLQGLLEALFDLLIVASPFHPDEVDDNQPGQVPEPELPREFVNRLQIGLERRFLDVPLANGAARVDVNGDQCLGLGDDHRPAGRQPHLRPMDVGQRSFDGVGMVEREIAPVQLDVSRFRRRQGLGDFLGPSVGSLAGDDDLVHIGLIHVAHRALDQVVLLVDQGRADRVEGLFPDVGPKRDDVVEVTADFRPGAALGDSAQYH